MQNRSFSWLVFHSESDIVSDRLRLFCRKQRYSRMDKERSYADVVSGSGKFIALSFFFWRFGNFFTTTIVIFD